MNPIDASGSPGRLGRERRRKTRFRMPFAVTVRGTDEAGQAFELGSRIETISASGLYLKLGRRIPLGTLLDVVVDLNQPPAEPADSAGLIAQGEAVRSETDPDGSCGVALRFRRWRLCNGAQIPGELSGRRSRTTSPRKTATT